ncbi:MAG: hypothetical protein Aureis2KO_05490 [Aureisphaera sp.]
MGFHFYQPSSEFQEGSKASSLISYAVANLPFFSGPWLSQFSPCNAMSILWPGEKLAAIIQELSKHQNQNNDCGALLVAYKKIYRRLTLTDFSLEKNETKE